MLDAALEPGRLRLWSGAVAAGLLAALGLSVLSADGASMAGGRLGGDLPAFYGAGRILLAGDAASLYDWGRQSAAQADLHPGADGGAFLAFAYPPFVAVPYALLALLPYRVAYLVHTSVAIAAVAAAVRGLASHLPRVARHPLAATVAAITFFPLFRSVSGAQNTQFSLLFLAMFGWGISAVVGGRSDAARRGDGVAGVGLGLLAFKPQFLPLALVAALMMRRPRMMAVAAVIWAALYAVAAAVGGWAWPLWWWRDGVQRFHQHDQAVNASNSVGWLGVAEALFGVGSPIAQGLGLALMAATLALVGGAFFRPRGDAWGRAGLLASATLVFSPHAMFYDAGLLVLPMAVIADRVGRPAIPWLAACWAVAALHPLAPVLGITPLFGVAAALVAWSGWRAVRGG
jgi:hypothetical protein